MLAGAKLSPGSIRDFGFLHPLLFAVYGRQGDAAERFAGASRTNGHKPVEIAAGCRACGIKAIGDFHQLVGIGAVVAVQADVIWNPPSLIRSTIGADKRGRH